jgi:3D (Asp-Asp-Asp) domain-containing protein
MAFLNLVTALGIGLLIATSLGSPDVHADALVGSSALVLGTGGSGVKVRSGPGLSYGIVGAAPEGTRVDVLDGPQSGDDQNWYRVTWTDGADVRVRGWVSSGYLVSGSSVTFRDGSLGSRSFNGKIAAYASGGGIGVFTSTGTKVHWGTIAVDPAFLPLGSLVLIDGLDGVFTAEDTGGGVKGAMLDVWFPDRPAALAWGTRERKVTVLREGY